MRDPHRRLPQPPSRREMVLRDMASSRQPSPCALSPSRKTYLGYCFRRDGSLSRHHPHWTDVLGSGVLSWHREVCSSTSVSATPAFFASMTPAAQPST